LSVVADFKVKAGFARRQSAAGANLAAGIDGVVLGGVDFVQAGVNADIAVAVVEDWDDVTRGLSVRTIPGSFADSVGWEKTMRLTASRRPAVTTTTVEATTRPRPKRCSRLAILYPLLPGYGFTGPARLLSTVT